MQTKVVCKMQCWDAKYVMKEQILHSGESTHSQFIVGFNNYCRFPIMWIECIGYKTRISFQLFGLQSEDHRVVSCKEFDLFLFKFIYE